MECPACRGEGRLSTRTLDRCPVCRGFEQVPRSLSDWFEQELAAEEAPDNEASEASRHDRAASEGVRYGRCAEVALKVSLGEASEFSPAGTPYGGRP